MVQAAAGTSRRAAECLGCAAVHGCCLPAPLPGITRPRAAGRGPTPRPTWSSPDSAVVTDRSLWSLSRHGGGRGNTLFCQMRFVGSGELRAVGAVG